jgi:hypothetical protein
MNLRYGLKGKGVASVEGATQVPREGDWVYLNLNGTEEVFKVRRVVWESELVEGSDDKQGLDRLHRENDVLVFIESLDEEKKEP